MLDVSVIETSGLGDRSYLVSDGEIAVAIDPQRDIDRVLELADGLRITHVLETHIHNDYVTGGLALSNASGAEYVLPAGEDVDFSCRAVSEGDRIDTGGIHLEVLLTPGHTQGQGFAVDRGVQRWELERQVRLVAGSIVLSSVLGSVAIPRLKWLAAAIGGGLTFAAVSNTCAMGTALSKLPYDRGATSDAKAILAQLSSSRDATQATLARRLTRPRPKSSELRCRRSQGDSIRAVRAVCGRLGRSPEPAPWWARWIHTG